MSSQWSSEDGRLDGLPWCREWDENWEIYCLLKGGQQSKDYRTPPSLWKVGSHKKLNWVWHFVFILDWTHPHLVNPYNHRLNPSAMTWVSFEMLLHFGVFECPFKFMFRMKIPFHPALVQHWGLFWAEGRDAVQIRWLAWLSWNKWGCRLGTPGKHSSASYNQGWQLSWPYSDHCWTWICSVDGTWNN